MINRLKKKLNSIKKGVIDRYLKGDLQPNSELFYDIVPKHEKIHRVAKGFRFTEGPVWISDEQGLLFSDIPANTIYKLDQFGEVSVFRKPSGNSNGLALDRQGRLIACEHGTRRVTRTEKDGTVRVLADMFNGRKLNSPNDVVVKSDGSIYFTDPPYGIQPEEQEQPVQAVYRISEDGGKIDIVADDFICPNGLAFSPDESKLYIDDSSPLRRHLRVVDFQKRGSLSPAKLFYDMNSDATGSPDGMKLNIRGDIFCTGPGGVWVFTDEGFHLGTIVTPENPSNCAWGDKDGRTLFITACTSIYKIKLKLPGVSADRLYE